MFFRYFHFQAGETEAWGLNDLPKCIGSGRLLHLSSGLQVKVLFIVVMWIPRLYLIPKLVFPFIFMTSED